jgi:hypothetical protein
MYELLCSMIWHCSSTVPLIMEQKSAVDANLGCLNASARSSSPSFPLTITSAELRTTPASVQVHCETRLRTGCTARTRSMCEGPHTVSPDNQQHSQRNSLGVVLCPNCSRPDPHRKQRCEFTSHRRAGLVCVTDLAGTETLAPRDWIWVYSKLLSKLLEDAVELQQPSWCQHPTTSIPFNDEDTQHENRSRELHTTQSAC